MRFQRKTQPSATVDADDDKETDYVAVTNVADSARLREEMPPDSSELDEIVDRHRRVFIERAFPPEREVAQGDVNAKKKKSASILACRPQRELDYIEFVVKNWHVGVELRRMLPGCDRDEITQFR